MRPTTMRTTTIGHRVIGSLILALLSAACASRTAAPAAGPAPQVAAGLAAGDDLDQPLPLDKRVRTGKLANGLTYFILPHKKPEKRAQLWLAVDAGSVLEDDDQQGLAHFVEHMGFNGTKRFPKQALVSFMESIGVKFGADLNASTSFDRTVYTLQVPTDRPQPVATALQVLRDWAGDVSFQAEEVEKERGVVLEEWRLGRGAGTRVWDEQAPIVFHGSKYARRRPIGKPEIIKGAPREAMVRFYRDWYRPDLMAVIAVGDFDGDDMKGRIEREFAGLTAPAKPRLRPTIDVPPHGDVLVSVATDPEMPNTTVSLLGKMPHRPERTVRDFRRQAAERLYHTMVNARLDEIRRRPDAPFVSAGSSTRELVRPVDVFSTGALVKGDAVETALTAVLEEIARVERHGFTASELDRAKRSMLRGYQQLVVQHDKRDARTFASELVDHFLEGEEVPGVEVELALVEKLLPTITLQELNGLARTWSGAANRVITVVGPESMKKPSPEALVALVKSAQGRAVAAYEDRVSQQSLLAAPPKPGKVISETNIAEIGVTEWRLSNGVRVIAKPTDFRNDEVRFTAFSPGGHSLVNDGDYQSARFASQVVAEGGVGGFSAVDLRKALAGKVVAVGAGVSELEEDLAGSASRQDLETMFQLIHLRVTAPRRDPTAFEAWRARLTEAVKNRRLNPAQSFAEDFAAFATQNHPRRSPATPETLAKVDLDKIMAVYQDRFADAGDFTFVFVGNLELPRLKTLAETYLGSLPTKGRKESWRDVKVRPPTGVKTKEVALGREPKSRVVLMFHGDETWTRELQNDMTMLGEVLRIRLREVLREDMGGVYGVSAGGGIQRRPFPLYTFSVSFGCAPENVEKLKQAVWDEIKALQDRGIGAEYIAKVKAARLRSHEVSLKDNGFWERELRAAYLYGDDPRLIPQIQPLVDAITSDRVRAAARKYLRPTQYVLGVLKPQEVASKP